MLTSGTQQFTATVTGTTNTAVTWSATGGSISSSGLYTAPSTAGTYTVKVTSVADNTKSASATITVSATVVAVSISPTSAAMLTSGTQQFTATVTGTTNTAVTWSATGGSISSGGLYTAPSTAGTYTVQATSVADNTKSASATVAVSAAVVTISISPTSASLATGGTQQFTATVSGTTNTAVTWSVTGGSISSGGLYTAPSTAGTYTVQATSVADNTKSASATVAVSAAVVTISISPTSVSLATGGTQQFTATVSGNSNTAVTWSATGGTISASGLYTASSTAGSYAVKATSLADSTKSASATVTVSSLPSFGHVFIVVDENTDYSSVVGSSSMPYLNSLISQYGLATNYYADTHPSIGNYMALTTGQILTNDDSQTPSSFPVSVDNIAHELELAGKTWKDYPETTGTYYVRHDPLQYMTNINTANLSNFSQFANDLKAGTLPQFSWITPNGCDDAHDCSLSTADSWLQSNINPLIQSALFQKDGLLIIVFDEDGSGSTSCTSTGQGCGGHVAAVIVSPKIVSPGFTSNKAYEHENILRLMAEGLGLTTFPGAAAKAANMSEFFSQSSTATAVSVSISPTSVSVQTGQTKQFTASVTGTTNTNVTWQVNRVSGGSTATGTISSTGLYTAPSSVPSVSSTGLYTAPSSVPSVNPVTVTAQSVYDSTKAGNATVTIAGVTACVGTCYYVSPTGSDSNSGTSAAPFQTIQHAADIVNPGDTVIVEDGIYNGGCTALTQTVTVNRGGTSGNFVTFKSANKYGAKLDGGNICRDGWVIGNGVSYVRIQDFEITGYAASGGTWADGLQLDCGTCSNINIVGNKIHDVGKICTDTANGQNGIFMNANNITVEQNSIYNIGRFAPGENGCNPSTSYYQNHDHGIYDYRSDRTKIQNNIFYQNVHGWSIQVSPGSSTNLLIINNTFSDPNPYKQGHIICWGTGSMSGYISNNIFYQPNTAAIWDQYCAGITVNYNLSTNGDKYDQCGSSCASYANDLLNQNPTTIMISPDTDFHLILGSPAIGAGTSTNAPATDFNGNPRKNPPSIGAYEWGSTP